MDARSPLAGEPAGDPPTLPRQRWGLVLARSANAPHLAGRELTDAWEQAVEATGLPVHRAGGRARTRVALGAPLPVGMAAERELAEIVLTEVLPIWQVRDALVECLPAGWTLVDLHDVWLGASALAGRVQGAVYRVAVGGTADHERVASAASALLEAERLPRSRLKGGSPVVYDLRRLLAGIRVLDPGPPLVLQMQTLVHPELGTGRPEEVLAALADQLGCPLTQLSIVRERLLVAGDSAGRDLGQLRPLT